MKAWKKVFQSNKKSKKNVKGNDLEQVSVESIAGSESGPTVSGVASLGSPLIAQRDNFRIEQRPTQIKSRENEQNIVQMPNERVTESRVDTNDVTNPLLTKHNTFFTPNNDVVGNSEKTTGPDAQSDHSENDDSWNSEDSETSRQEEKPDVSKFFQHSGQNPEETQEVEKHSHEKIGNAANLTKDVLVEISEKEDSPDISNNNSNSFKEGKANSMIEVQNSNEVIKIPIKPINEKAKISNTKPLFLEELEEEIRKRKLRKSAASKDLTQDNIFFDHELSDKNVMEQICKGSSSNDDEYSFDDTPQPGDFNLKQSIHDVEKIENDESQLALAFDLSDIETFPELLSLAHEESLAMLPAIQVTGRATNDHYNDSKELAVESQAVNKQKESPLISLGTEVLEPLEERENDQIVHAEYSNYSSVYSTAIKAAMLPSDQEEQPLSTTSSVHDLELAELAMELPLKHYRQSSSGSAFAGENALNHTGESDSSASGFEIKQSSLALDSFQRTLELKSSTNSLNMDAMGDMKIRASYASSFGAPRYSDPVISAPLYFRQNFNQSEFQRNYDGHPRSVLTINQNSKFGMHPKISTFANSGTAPDQKRRISLPTNLTVNDGDGTDDAINELFKKAQELIEKVPSNTLEKSSELSTSDTNLNADRKRSGASIHASSSNELLGGLGSSDLSAEPSNENFLIAGKNGPSPSYQDNKSCCSEFAVQSSYTSDPKLSYQNVGYRYCDSVPSGNDDPQVIGTIINDLRCVFDKTFVQNSSLQHQYVSAQDDLDEVQEELQECETCRDELEREVIRLRGEVQASQRALDEEIQRRIALEGLVAQLKVQLGRLEAICDSDSQEKNQLANCLKDAEMKLRELIDAVQYLERDRDQLLRNCRGFEEMRERESETITISQGRCDQLEEALAKCCKANEELQAEIRKLKQEAKYWICEQQKLEKEKNQILEELNRERKCWAAERERFEEAIREFRKAYEELTNQNQEICAKMNEVVSAHHSEMDCLRKEIEKYKIFYENEKSERQKLERALRDCEERKKEIFKQQVQSSMQKNTTFDPCASETYTSEYTSERMEYTKDLQSKLETANTRTAMLEREVKQNQAELQEKKMALVISQQELERLRLSPGTPEDLKSKLHYGSEKVVKLEELLQQNQADYKDVVQALEKSQQEVEKLRISQTLLETELENARTKTAAIENNYNLQSQLNLKEKAAILVGKARNEVDNFKELEDMKSKLSNANNRISVLEKEVLASKDALAEKVRAFEKSQLQIEKLRHSQKTLEELRANLDNANQTTEELEQGLEEKASALEKAQKEIEKLQLSQMTLKDTRTKLDEAKSKISELEEDLDHQSMNFKEKAVALEKAQEELEKLRSSHRKLEKKQDSTEVDKLTTQCRNLKLELKSEREHVYKLKQKCELQREQIKSAANHLEVARKDPRSQRLIIQLDEAKVEHEKAVMKAKKQNEELLAETHRLRNENSRLGRELVDVQNNLQMDNITNSALQELNKRKDKLEKEIYDLRKSINEKYVERTEVDRWKATYDASIAALEARYELSFKKQLSIKIAEVSAQLQRQSRDRTLIDEMREANEKSLRSEYGQVTTNLKSDIENLRKLVKAREEEIITLKSSMTRLKRKYTSEATEKEELLKQVQLLASSSRTSLINNNN